MHSSASVEIDRPIDEVFEYTLENVPEWSITVVEDEVIEQTPDRVGTTFRCVTEDHGKKMVFQGLVTRHDPPTFSACQLIGDMFDIDLEYEFEDLSGRTRVTQWSNVKPKGFLKVIFALFGWAMKKSGCKAADNELNSLKSILESRNASAAD